MTKSFGLCRPKSASADEGRLAGRQRLKRRLSAVPVLSVRGHDRAKHLDPKVLVTLQEPAISTMRETPALVELLERKGILTKQEVLAMIQELRRREPTAIPPRR